ncbi:hypothetical protein DHX103_11245 [Planococcus sp. X10-3]|uniref:hypothetical protein n=1 Tax=Planococcus sp. X10-3 TaxID=3061240 RepID=UPI003BAEFC0D
MNQQEPLEKEELQAARDSNEPIEPKQFDHTMEHRDGIVEPKLKDYVPLQVGMVIFTIIILVLVFVGSISNMWGLID